MSDFKTVILFPILPNGREKTRHCPLCTRQYSLTDFPISQPCIYIISYSVEFVKRFSTLFLFFFGKSVRDHFSLTEALATARDFLLHPFS